MARRNLVVLLHSFIQLLLVAGDTASQDYSALIALTGSWQNWPPNWNGQDPCGEGWQGIWCSGTRVTSIVLPSMNLTGTLSSNIQQLSALRILDLSYNKNLGGMIPPSIGNLKKLLNLVLIGCSFYGPLPDTIGSLQSLNFLSLNSNNFSGRIPNSIGYLSNLFWLDLSDNQLDGPVPVSKGTTPGLDMLVGAGHFHLGNNKLSDSIPSQLFSSKMTLRHVLLDSNELTGNIPGTLGLVQTLEVVRLDRNTLTGTVPTNLNNLTNLKELFLSNNKLSGSVPNLTGMNNLNYVDMSNNSFLPSVLPSWFSTLRSLTTIQMQNTQLQAQLPVSLFSIPNLETVILGDNQLNGTLNIGTSYSSELQLIDLQNNLISSPPEAMGDNISLILVGNPICKGRGVTMTYCTVPQSNTSYSVPAINCANLCGLDQIISPSCQCSYPYSGNLVFRTISFSDLSNSSYFVALEKALINSFKSNLLPVDLVSLSNPTFDSLAYLNVNLKMFPLGQDCFNMTGIFGIAFVLSNQIFEPPDFFGPYYFEGDSYGNFAELRVRTNKSASKGIIIGAIVGGSILLLVLVLVGFYAFRQKKRAERAVESNPFAQWNENKSIGGVPQLKGARWFSFEELKKYTNNFSEMNEIGSGGYGKVYRGILPAGQFVAIKRAVSESMQGGSEFKTEIELLSRVHHKNLVNLVGFCFEKGEQMLVYEYVPNGTLRETLSGKSGIRLDWMRRLKISLGAARGVAYLHEFADPPIIHRDIKSTNILLDGHLTAKVADFGLSKTMGDSEKSHVSTQVKGTLGYLDPEYYMTQQLTEKSDVYSFGVLMLELITARRPIYKGKFIVREVQMEMNKSKGLYNLNEILDPTISSGMELKGLEKFVELAMRCVEELGDDRPTMVEVAKEIENIMQLAGIKPKAESASTSETYDEASLGYHPYIAEGFAYSGEFRPPS
ncbi:hypothetical protein UlMin_046274 [Ulmus minor]